MSGDSAPKKGSIQKWDNGFQLERLAMGKSDGKLAKPGKKVVVRYRGSLQSGKVFDETKGNKTFSFRLGKAPAPYCFPPSPTGFPFPSLAPATASFLFLPPFLFLKSTLPV